MLIVCPDCYTKNRVQPERLIQNPNCGHCKTALFKGQPYTITEQHFDDVIQHTDIPIIIDCWAAWCGPCRAFAPTYAQAASQLEPHIRLLKLDTEANPNLAARLNIRSIPTLIAYQNGRETQRISGALPLPQLLQWANQLTTN